MVETRYLCSKCKTAFKTFDLAERCESVPIAGREMPVGFIFKGGYQLQDDEEWKWRDTLIVFEEMPALKKDHSRRYRLRNIYEEDSEYFKKGIQFEGDKVSSIRTSEAIIKDIEKREYARLFDKNELRKYQALIDKAHPDLKLKLTNRL